MQVARNILFFICNLISLWRLQARKVQLEQYLCRLASLSKNAADTEARPDNEERERECFIFKWHRTRWYLRYFMKFRSIYTRFPCSLSVH